MSKTIIQEYYKYCDDLVEDWIDNDANLTIDDPFLQNSVVLSSKPYFDIMPEPFLGNPEKCSIVMMNLNPGYTEGDDETLSRQNTQARYKSLKLNGFSDFARPFPYIATPSVHPAGADWWKKRKDYLDRLVLAYTGQPSKHLPFAIELCPWHSKKWGEAKVRMVSIVRDRMIKRSVIPALYAIGQSDAKLAVVVGKAAIPVLRAAGFKLVQSWGPSVRMLGKRKGKPYDNLMNNISFPNTDFPNVIYPQTIKHENDIPIGESDAEVFYRYFKADIRSIREKMELDKEVLLNLPSGELKVLSIYMTGSNKTPGPEFYERGIEQIILDYIRQH